MTDFSRIHPAGIFSAIYEGSRSSSGPRGYKLDAYRMPDGRIIYYARFSGDPPEIGTRHHVEVKIRQWTGESNSFYNTLDLTKPPLWFWSEAA